MWRSVDEARMVVRIMVFAKFAALMGFVYMVTRGLFALASEAMQRDLDLAQAAVLIGAVTAFATTTIPILVSIYRDVWKDYRQSGTDWDRVGKG
jgi:hypothetical protein